MKGDNQQHALNQVILNYPDDYRITFQNSLSQSSLFSAIQGRS